MAVATSFLKRVCCSSAIPSIEPSSIKEEMVLVAPDTSRFLRRPQACPRAGAVSLACARHGMKHRRSSDRCQIPCSRLSPAASAKTRRQKGHKPSHCFRFDGEVHTSRANRSHSPGHRYLTAARVRSTFHIPRVVNVTARTFDETGRYAA
jgi:hypothetical protein